MAIPVLMPKQGQSVETCIITRWLRNKGEKVSTGDILFSYETDKAAFDLESPGDGFLIDIFFKEGDEVPVLVNVAVIGQQGEPTDVFRPQNTAENTRDTSPTQKNKEHITAPASDVKPFSPSDGSMTRISPRAKKLAESKNLDYKNIHGSGPNGRILCSDIEEALTGNKTYEKSFLQAGNEFTDLPLSNVRKLIAQAMYSSLRSSAQLTHHMSADVRRLLEARRKNKENIASGSEKHDITINDMVCWCVIKALEKHPEVNTHFLDDKIRTFKSVHLGSAVDTQRGLMVPVIKNAGMMDIKQLSAALKWAADECRKGNIDPELIKSTAATFTVSNLGNYGVEMFTPVINLPQAAILGVNTIIYRPRPVKEYSVEFVPYIGLSLTYDHRAVDGGPATKFLAEIRTEIENFEWTPES